MSSSKSKKSKMVDDLILKEDFGTTEEFVCRVCGEVLSTLETYIDHRRRRHKSLVDKNCIGIPKKCNLCAVYFGSEGGLGNHLRDVHGVDQPSSIDEIDVETEEFVPLPVKPETAKRRKRKSYIPQSRNDEVIVVTSDQANSCSPQTDRSNEVTEKSQTLPVSSVGELKNESAASLNETFKCRFCQKISRSSRDHVRHVRNCNPNATDFDIFDDPHECPLCHRVFQSRMNLERHFHMKHRGEPWGIMDPNIGAYDACNELKSGRSSLLHSSTLPPPNLKRISNLHKNQPNNQSIPNLHKIQTRTE